MKRVTGLTHERLTEVLDFDPATGVFVWKQTSSNRVRVGSVAGSHHKASGGRYLSIDGEKWMAHRLAWFYAKGEPAADDVRPVDGDYSNCALSNLREVTRSELQHRRGAQSNNTSGHVGVSAAPHGKWQAKLTWNYQQISLGMNFATREEASDVVQSALSQLRSAKSDDEVTLIIARFTREKRQRAAWASLIRSAAPLGWASFAEFSETVIDVPTQRYAMAPVDAALPIGPGNYRWASEGHSETGTVAGRVQYARENRKRNGDHIRGRRFMAEYGIDFAQYQAMLLAQNGVCAICEKPETKVQNGTIRLLSVDHNHATGAVRGLLCANCNMAIGYACDDVSVLQKAIGYLRKHDGSSVVVPFDATSTLGFGA